LDSEDNIIPNFGDVDENYFRHNRHFQENSEDNTHFKRENLLENVVDLREIKKNLY